MAMDTAVRSVQLCVGSAGPGSGLEDLVGATRPEQLLSERGPACALGVPLEERCVSEGVRPAATSHFTWHKPDKKAKEASQQQHQGNALHGPQIPPHRPPVCYSTTSQGMASQ